MTQPVARELRGAVLRLTLNDPATRNSLSSSMMTALQEALDAAAADPACRAIVVAAQGPVYSSGHDLKEISDRRADADGGAAFFAALMAQCGRLMQAIVRHPRPVIAQVQGMASAAGCQLVACCDLAVASSEARFCTPGVNIGLFCSTPMVALSRDVGRKHAMEMLLTGDTFDALEAQRMGLVNRVVSPNELAGAADGLAERIACKSPMTVKTGKEAFYRQLEMPLAEAHAYTAGVMVENLLREDAREGIAAFLEKRPARWPDV